MQTPQGERGRERVAECESRLAQKKEHTSEDGSVCVHYVI